MTRSEAWAMFATQALGVLTSTPLDAETRHRLALAQGLESLDGYTGETVEAILSTVRGDNVRGAAMWADELLVEFDRRFKTASHDQIIETNGDHA